jgi:hypothetical protein
MSLQISNKERKELYNKYYSDAKSRGASDRDANIATIRKLSPRSGERLARDYNMSEDEVENIATTYW